MSSLALKLRNTLESLKRNASAPDKWAQVCPLLKSRKDTEFLSNSLILTLLKLVERDLTSANRDSAIQCRQCLQDVLSEPACLSVLESDHVHSLILILLKNIEAVDDNEGRKDMLRALSVMRLSQEMMDVVGPVLLARLGKISTSSESLTVMETVFERCPRLIVKSSPSWFLSVLSALTSSDESLREEADKFLIKYMPHFYEDDVGNAASEYLEELKSAHGDNCIRLIQSQGSGDSVQLLKIWAHTLLSFQHTIHRTHVLNTMLSLIEGTFNTGKAVHRGAAFIAWRRLVLNLACQGHLFNPKRVNLVLLPVWNGLKHEKSMAVRSECIQTFAFLILNLSFHSSLKSLLEPVFRTAIHDKDVDGKMDFQLVLWQILVILATPKPRVSVSLRNLCEQSDQPPEVLLRWMNSAPEEDLPFISGMLLEVLEKEQQSTQMRLPEEEAVIVDLLKAAKNLADKSLKDKSYDERLKSVEEYLKTSNFSSEFFSGNTGMDLSIVTPSAAAGFKALKSDSVNYVHIPPMSEAELIHKNMSDGIRTERQMEKKLETSVKMYNSLDPSQVLTIEHLESLVNVQHVQTPDARIAKRPRLDDKENVPTESPFVNQLKSILNRNLSGCPTRELLELQSSLLQALTEVSGEIQKRLSN